MSKAKQTSKAAKQQAAPAQLSANSKQQLAAIAASKAHADKTFQPAIIANIMQQLYNAKLAKQHISAAQILAALSKQYPQRPPQRMSITVRAQLARMQDERGFMLSKQRAGRNVLYAAAE